MMLPFSRLLAYGLFGLPLALAALPIYVYVPQFYAERFGMSLSLIGGVLLAARLLDAFLDPLLGLWVDRVRSRQGYGSFILASLPLLSLGFVALFHPPAMTAGSALAWMLFSLLLVYGGFSLAMIAHQSWGAALTQTAGERARVAATREGCGLLGVIAAAGMAGWLGLGWLSLTFVFVLLFAATLLLRVAPRPAHAAAMQEGLKALLEPFRNARFCWLFAVLVVNGIAAAIPATLFLFFVRDQLQLAQHAGLFLALYFLAGACSMPLWVALAGKFGEARAWLVAMLVSASVFVWAFGLSAGAAFSFGLICLLSGAALGADLALAPALLAAVIRQAGHSGQREGAYFGVWNWAGKMNLALAAGIALPLLEMLGYVPGTANSDGMQALSIAYAVLPCLLKVAAAGILLHAPLRDV